MLGGTGFIGSHLLVSLSRQNHNIAALVRKTSQSRLPENIETVYGELPQSLNNLQGQWDTVINAAGLMGKFSVTQGSLWKVNAEAPEALYRLCLKRRVRHFIHLSTVGVSGPTQGKVFAENDVCKPANDYERSKHEGERRLLKIHQPDQCLVTVIRPGFTYGPGDLHKLSLFKSIYRKRFLLVGAGDGLLQPIYIDDLITGIERIIHRRPQETHIFNLCGDQPITWEYFTAILAREMHRQIPAFKIPVSLAHLAARLCETAGRLFSFNPMITHSRVSLMSQSYAYSIQHAKTILQFEPETGLEEGVARTINWYREHHLL